MRNTDHGFARRALLARAGLDGVSGGLPVPPRLGLPGNADR